MKILFILNKLPLPANSGNQMRTWCFIKALASENEISLICCDKNNTDDAIINELKKYFINVWIVKLEHKDEYIRKSKKIDNFIYFLKGIPWDISGSYSNEFNKKFVEIINNYNFDIFFIRYIFPTIYILKNISIIKAKIIVDLDDIETIKINRTISADKYKLNGLYDSFRKHLNLNAFERYYKKMKLMSSCIVCSKKDFDYVKNKGWNKNVNIVNNSIDFLNYSAIEDYDRQSFSNKVILFCGNLDYDPNVDGIEWFIKNIFPLIKLKEPNVKLYVVGLRPREFMYRHVDNESIFIYSNVPNVIPYYKKCSVVIVPLRIGGGTRIKILESIACSRPVISTTIGAEGLGLENGKHCLLYDSPKEFALGCVDLLNDYSKGQTLCRNGLNFIKNNFDIGVTNKLIEGFFNNG